VALDIKRILNDMIARGASDLHLKVASPPVLRVNGNLLYMELPAPSVQEMVAVAQQILTPAQREQFEATREIDFAFGVPGVARFRANFYVQRGSIAMVFRHVPVQIKSLDDLELPPVIRDLAMKSRGLILITGTVGSGKSTTLATMVDIINRPREPRHHHRGPDRVPAPRQAVASSASARWAPTRAATPRRCGTFCARTRTSS
jgi:twitching motility protein PilT